MRAAAPIICGSALLLAAAGGGSTAGSTARAAVAPVRPWRCPGDHPIKITALGSTLSPWARGYGSARTLACYRSEAAAAAAGYLVPIEDK